MSDDKIEALKREIANLESQWPAHSVPPTMLQRLDELEEELEKELQKADEAVLTPIHPVGVGEIIGCPALVSPYTHRCTARSLTRIEVLAIDAVGLRKLFVQDCQLAVSIQQYVIQALLERIGKLRLAGTEYA